LPGKVYFSRPGAEGEVARITIVVPAKVGPFDLHHTIVNELAIKLRGQDGNVGLDNVGKDKLPTIVEGIPVRVREIQLKIDRDHFLRNPLVCDALEGSGVFGALDGRTATVKAPFQATGCDTLAFTPRLNATVGSADNPAKVGHHPTFTTVVTQADHQAAIKKSVVTLPQGLIANPTALGNLCSVQQAQDNACPDSTRVGTAKAISPLVPDALTGAVFVAENPSGGLPRLVMRVSNSLLNVPIEATTTLKSTGQLVTTLDNLPAAPVTSFELTIDGGSKGLFTVSNSLCSNPTVAGTFSSHTGQSFDDSSPVNIVGDCKPVPDPNAAASKRKPSLTVSVRRLGSQPLVTLRAHSASSGRRLRSLRVVLPSRLVVSSAKVRKGLSVLVGGRKLSRSAYSLSRHGVLSVRVARSGSSQIIVSLRSGAIRANRTLRGLARRHRALPRLVFTGRVVDVKNTRFSYRVRVRPNR